MSVYKNSCLSKSSRKERKKERGETKLNKERKTKFLKKRQRIRNNIEKKRNVRLRYKTRMNKTKECEKEKKKKSRRERGEIARWGEREMKRAR